MGRGGSGDEEDLGVWVDCVGGRGVSWGVRWLRVRG